MALNAFSVSVNRLFAVFVPHLFGFACFYDDDDAGE